MMLQQNHEGVKGCIKKRVWKMSSSPHKPQCSLQKEIEQVLLTKYPLFLHMEEEGPKTFSEQSNNTWVLKDLPPGCKLIKFKWVFRRKRNTDGTVHTFKARLAVKGFTQKEGIDYFDTYAPVTRISYIRTLIALATIHGFFNGNF